MKESDELTMQVSPICRKDGKKVAYVTFKDTTRSAEGIIPACMIIKNKGFTEDEVIGLEVYMKGNLEELKKMAASVNVADAFLGKR